MAEVTVPPQVGFGPQRQRGGAAAAEAHHASGERGGWGEAGRRLRRVGREHGDALHQLGDQPLLLGGEDLACLVNPESEPSSPAAQRQPRPFFDTEQVLEGLG